MVERVDCQKFQLQNYKQHQHNQHFQQIVTVTQHINECVHNFTLCTSKCSVKTKCKCKHLFFRYKKI